MFIDYPRLLRSVGVVALSAILTLIVQSQNVCGQTDAKSRSNSNPRSSEKRVLIEPYTGPPIFLEEKRVVVPPTIVVRDVHTDKYPDGKSRVERQIARYSDDHRESDGFYREFYPNGTKFIEGQYRNGRQEGEWSYYYDNGQLNRKVTYQNGRLHGAWERFRADGTLAAKHSYENGLRHGAWLTYDATGKQLLQEEHYNKSKPDGTMKAWYPDGKPKLEIGMKDGKRHGKSIQYDESGKKIVEANFVEDKLDGQTMRVGTDGKQVIQEYKNGLLVSERKG
jgi:antitoxin component YwqK of YwqJK toxin-antitoxin module